MCVSDCDLIEKKESILPGSSRKREFVQFIFVKKFFRTHTCGARERKSAEHIDPINKYHMNPVDRYFSLSTISRTSQKHKFHLHQNAFIDIGIGLKRSLDFLLIHLCTHSHSFMLIYELTFLLWNKKVKQNEEQLPI